MIDLWVGKRVRRPYLNCGIHLGDYWRAGYRHEVFAWGDNLQVTRYVFRAEVGYTWLWRVTFYGSWSLEKTRHWEMNAMASKWIKQAMAKVGGKAGSQAKLDDFVGKGRPALTDFMTELKDGDGVERDLSCVMFQAGDAGGIRAGLKDETLGWCWREAATLAEALDAIEKALQVGEGAFRPAGGWKGRKKR